MSTVFTCTAGPPGSVGDTGEEGPEGFSYDGDPGMVTCQPVGWLDGWSQTPDYKCKDSH